MAPLFGGRGDGPRSSADREAARLERERRRAVREGRPLPEDPEDGAPADAPEDDGRPAVPPDAPAPFEWDAPGEYDPHVSAARPVEDQEPGTWEPEPPGSDPEPEPRTREPEPEPRAEEPQPEPEAWEPEPEAPEPETWEPAPAAPEGWRQEAPEPAAWPAGPEERAPTWSDGNGVHPPADGDAGGAPHEADPAAAPHASANGHDDPQATQPFDPVGAPTVTRRTVSLPRPQTDTGEWDAPIGTVRVSRGGGGGGAGGRYQAQPGASGYPPYRKLEVKPRRRWLRRIVVLLALLLAIAACAFVFLLFQPKHGSGHGTVVVTIPAGATADQIGHILADRGVVSSPFFFSLRTRLSGDRSKLRSGRYTMREGMSYGAALTALTTPPKAAPTVNITLPEGPSRREEAAKLKAAGVKGSYLAATKRSSRLDPRTYGAPRSTRTLEGFLYPSTYELKTSQATAKRLVNKQLAAFKENFGKVDMRAARRKNLSRYDVLIIASMIEREALVPRDRRLISAVIYNRLKENIPLGIDATLRYSLNQWSRPLRVSELNSNSSFNTRKRRGLPPTPIGNPGLASIRAAANPAHVPYLFYVVKPCGNGAHAFSSTDAKFQQDVAKYNRARAKRGGKDPSHC
jgi:UPF0755 protein